VTDDALGTLDLEDTLVGTLGFEVLTADEDLARGSFEVTDRVRQILGIVHGGAYAALAETIVSHATALAVMGDGNVAIGQSNHTSFLRPVADGHVHAEGHPRHKGRTSWVWDVEFTDDEGRLCALSRVAIAVRPRG
jgi:1,4-dihydroxy-2-naphthoyl-CoA hydrolase